MKSNGLVLLNNLLHPRASRSLSATNSMYCSIVLAFSPIRETGNVSDMGQKCFVTTQAGVPEKNSFSMATALCIM